MAEILLSVKKLFLSLESNHEKVPVLQNINLDIHRGETMMIMGESGAGKSMLCHCLIRLEPAGSDLSGSILLQDGTKTTDLVGLPEKNCRSIRGRKIGILFQNASQSLSPVFTVLTQIRDVIDIAGSKEKTERAYHYLEMAGFSDPAAIGQFYPHELSGGMAQRVCLAITMASRPDLIIADEPAASMDAATAIDTYRILDNYKRDNNAAIICVSHDLRFSQKYADTILILYSGSVMETGTREVLLSVPRHPYSQALLECEAALFRGEISAGIPGDSPAEITQTRGCPFYSRCENADTRCRLERPELKSTGDSFCACHFALIISENHR